MNEAYRIVMLSPGSERMNQILAVEADTIEGAVLKVAVQASKLRRPLRGKEDYKLALQAYDHSTGVYETIEDMKCGAFGRWYV